MTYQDIDIMIESIGLPYAYHQFPIPDSGEDGQQPPFICWFFDGIDDVYADNSNYQKIVTLIIEFYSDEKDFETEAMIECSLKNAGFSYGMDEDYIDSERMHETIYTMEVVING